MGSADVEALKRGVGEQVVLGFRDGEVTLAEPHLVSEEDAVVIYDVVWTNRPERYPLAGAASQADLDDLDAVAGGDILQPLIATLFASDEDPFFIDGSAPIEEITTDAGRFLLEAEERFHFKFGTTDLGMTVPELALHIRRVTR